MQLSNEAYNLVYEKYKHQHQNRFTHILGVVEMALYLADLYEIDKEKAKIAALMHDYSKYDDFDDAYKLLNKEDLEECKKYPFLYHAYLSAEEYKKLLGNDNEIYLAIRNHVFGRPNMTKLEEIIMIADYTEKNRTYKECIEVREILLSGDLDLAIYKSLEYTISHCIKNNQLPHPRQIEVLNEYKLKVEKL